MNDRPHDQHCDRCDLAEFSGVTYKVAHQCGAVYGHLVCDREHGHSGSHRGYDEQIDEALFWGHQGKVING